MLHDENVALYTFRQPRDIETSKLLELFKAKVSVVEMFRGAIRTDLGLAKAEYQQVVTEPGAPIDGNNVFVAVLSKKQ